MQKVYQRKKYFMIFMIPTLAAFLVAFAIPFFMGLYLSFCNFKTIGNAKWVGLSNYAFVFKDSGGFIAALGFTAKVAIVGVLSTNILAFALALLLTKGLKGTNVYRTIFFLPNLIGGIILGYIWQLLLNGILIQVVQADLTTKASYGYWGIIILYNWQKIGYLMIIYIAGIQAISADLYEAANIDGANYWQTLKNIIIPLVMPSVTVCSFLSLTDCFKMYDQNLALTGGAPANQTAMLALDISNTYYNRVGFAGVGQAKAVVFTVLVFAIALIQLKATSSKEAK